jgi:predicted GNAT family acetyltransferase
MAPSDGGDDDRDLDETLEETFPASDAPANTTETGIRVGASPSPSDVVDNRAANRYELAVDGQIAVVEYERTPKSIMLMHTEVPPALRGRHVGDVIVTGALARARAEGLQVVVVCPFIRAYLQKHPAT